MKRKTPRKIWVGKINVGGGSPISVQSMTKTDTRNASQTIKQILELEEAGCELIRVAVPDMTAATALKEIKASIHIPLIADIHFDHHLAIESAKYVDKIRIDPGNITSPEKKKEIISVCKDFGIPIRIGINSGSLETDLIDKYGGVNHKTLVASALRQQEFFEKNDFQNMIFSLKASDVPTSIKAYESFSKKSDYPLHVGITQAGSGEEGKLKSAVGIGYLLARGIGDTIRVSLTNNPLEEVKTGFEILQSLDLRITKREIISCPTCGRAEIDLFNITEQVKELTREIKLPIKIAVMGCVVNGPGEAKEADIGIAGGKHSAVIFRKGVVVRTIPENEILGALLEEIEGMLEEKNLKVPADLRKLIKIKGLSSKQ
jgi:(E)-4-hydroxy-3-methylbut-2-enyl-diphosphate synthase